METAHSALRELLEERDKRYEDRAKSQDEAVDKALKAANQALDKALFALEGRLSNLNELRQVVVDQGKDFARSDEVELMIDTLKDRMNGLADLVHAQVLQREARGAGVKDVWAYLFGGVACVWGAVSTVLLLLHKGH